MQHLCSVRLGTRNGFPRKNHFSEFTSISQDIIKTGAVLNLMQEYNSMIIKASQEVRSSRGKSYGNLHVVG